MCAMHLCCSEAEQSNLMLKTRPRQLLDTLALDIPIPTEIGKNRQNCAYLDSLGHTQVKQ